MSTSSFDKKFVVKDPEVVEKVLKELEMIDEEKVLKSTETIVGDDQGLDYLGIIKPVHINSEELWAKVDNF